MATKKQKKELDETIEELQKRNKEDCKKAIKEIHAMSEKELRTVAKKIRPHSQALFEYLIELAREKKAAK